MTAPDLFELDTLDALLDRLAARAADRPAPPLVNALGDEVTALAAAGLVTVNPGDLITSQWGNLTYGQTNLAFASVADRNNQWPTPPEGAQCVTLDTNSPWIYRAGGWHGRPAGYLASIVGPTTTVSATINTTIMSLTATLTAGRRYRVHAYSRGQQLTAASTATFCSVTGVDLANFRFWEVPIGSVSASGSYGGGGTALVTPATTGAKTFSMVAYTNAGTMSYLANSCELSIEDVGG